MQAVTSSWLNLAKTIFKPDNRTLHGTNDHLWRKIRGVLCPRNEKTLPLRKATGSTSCSKQREWQRENNILFNNL